ncbi:hypothetical protein B1H41_00480 [Xanthomonas vasicola pv. vasculorum]|nr:hypothetical protein B1H32_01505 [Xanthomonas vasicola pv. vasculorum]OWF64545.1 hypothetical protein B1H41_00480 [Xanthomonas vasicola pv. vasculorum]PDM34763.1 hypothetical protein CQW50_08995 [Xanthomonas vasicola pv. vasculorum]
MRHLPLPLPLQSQNQSQNQNQNQNQNRVNAGLPHAVQAAAITDSARWCAYHAMPSQPEKYQRPVCHRVTKPSCAVPT